MTGDDAHREETLMLKGQEIVKNRAEIIKDLNRAAATELLAAYRYLFLSKVATGMHGREGAEKFAEMATGEWGHGATFPDRIVQLGGGRGAEGGGGGDARRRQGRR